MTTGIAAAAVLVLALLFSMLGLGGAMLYIPLLHWLGYDFKSVAIPTGLLLNGITALSAATVYLRSRMVDVAGSLPLVLFSFIGAPLGAMASRRLPSEWLVAAFAAVLLFAAIRMAFAKEPAASPQPIPIGLKIGLMGLAGAVSGFLAGLIGVGGGIFIVPVMLAIGYPTKTAAATSAFIVVFPSFSGFAGHVAIGSLNWPLVVATAAAVVVGAQLGARLMKHRVKAVWIRRIFAMVLLLVALRLTFSVFA